MNAKVMRDGRTTLWIEPDDRGLAYGDGVFETMLVHRGQVVWWREHWARLLRGAQALRLPVPDEQEIRRECESLLNDSPSGVLKLILTRGGGGRGYGLPGHASPTLIASSHALPTPVRGAIALRWCQMAMAIQPALAGIKHLNRLEQVLARAEWSDPEIFDGLMCDTEGRVISATSGNVFALIGGRWLTPGLQRCGVAGITRDWVLANVPGAATADLSAAEVSNAEEIFICNAVRGILPVARLGSREWPQHDAVDCLRRRLADAQPAFVIEEN